MQEGKRVMKAGDGTLHFQDDCQTVTKGGRRCGCNCDCMGQHYEATPAEAERFRRDNTPTEAKGDGG